MKKESKDDAEIKHKHKDSKEEEPLKCTAKTTHQ